MILEIVDIASDIAVAVKLHQEKNTEWWFRLTLILILVPLVLVNLFSIFWHHQVRNLKIYFNIMILLGMYKLHNFDFTEGHFKSRMCKKVFEFQSLYHYQQNNFFGSVRT